MPSTKSIPLKPIIFEFVNPSSLGEGHTMSASHGHSISFVPSDRKGARLECDFYLSAGEHDLCLMDEKGNETVPFEEC